LDIYFYAYFSLFIMVTLFVIQNLLVSFGNTISIRKAKRKASIKNLFPDGNRDLHIICSKQTFMTAPIEVYIDGEHVTTAFRGDKIHIPLDDNKHILRVVRTISEDSVSISEQENQQAYVSTNHSTIQLRLTHGNLKALDDEACKNFSKQKWSVLTIIASIQLFGILLLLKAFAVF